MREILFRGKRTDNGEWVEGFYVCLFEKEKGFYKPNHYIFDGNIKLGEERYVGHGNYVQEVTICKRKIDEKTVGQYTGLTDKNGKRIFEGDIIDTPDRLIKVVWFERNAQFDLNFIKHAHDKKIINFKGIEMRDLKEYEVIGNIHDNPELLKEGAEQ